MTHQISIRRFVFGFCVASAALAGQPVFATDLTFEFSLPSFGGDPASTSYYLNLMEQQKFNFATEAPPSDAELFEDQLRRRIIAAVSAQVVSSIYEGTFTTGDSFTVGDFTVLYIDPIEAGNICVEINDGISTTQVCVPAP